MAATVQTVAEAVEVVRRGGVIEAVVLSRQGLTDSDIGPLTAALAAAPAGIGRYTLDLEGNSITDQGLADIARVLGTPAAPVALKLGSFGDCGRRSRHRNGVPVFSLWRKPCRWRHRGRVRAGRLFFFFGLFRLGI